LQQNLARIDFSILLTEVMTIADEIDLQLNQGSNLPQTGTLQELRPLSATLRANLSTQRTLFRYSAGVRHL
jgi:hypothetical protein